jgi:hypothetical protein
MGKEENKQGGTSSNDARFHLHARVIYDELFDDGWCWCSAAQQQGPGEIRQCLNRHGMRKSNYHYISILGMQHLPLVGAAVSHSKHSTKYKFHLSVATITLIIQSNSTRQPPFWTYMHPSSFSTSSIKFPQGQQGSYTKGLPFKARLVDSQQLHIYLHSNQATWP